MRTRTPHSGARRLRTPDRVFQRRGLQQWVEGPERQKMLGRRVPDLGWSSKRRAVRRQKAVGQGVGRAGQLEKGEGAGGT